MIAPEQNAIEISNVGGTLIALVGIVGLISTLVVWLNDGQVPIFIESPDINNELSQMVNRTISLFEDGFNLVKNSFDSHEGSFNRNEFMCPDSGNGLQNLISCMGYLMDATIRNTIDGIINIIRFTMTAFRNLVGHFFPEHFLVSDGLNSLQLLIQRVVHLQSPATEKPQVLQIAESKIATESATDQGNTRASFTFEAFSDDVRDVKEQCTSQCATYASNMESFLYKDTAIQSTLVTTKMTKRDYIFDQLGHSELYVCQYSQTSNFGGVWLYFTEKCLCADGCDSTNYFGFPGCADILYRIGIPCSTTTPCNLARLCPFEDHRITLKDTDASRKLYSFIDGACLEVCASLAGYADFATLVALSGAYGTLSATNAFGAANSPFGTPIGVPAALLPGMI